jgi:hypothetical protein
MNTKVWLGALVIALFIIVIMGCDEGINDWTSSAKVAGYVYADAAHTMGLPGVQVVVEGDQGADNPYKGPDRVLTTDQNGYFEGFVFLGYNDADTTYRYLGDLDVAYFAGQWTFRWGGGITVAPGSVFTLPPVDTTMRSGQ